MATNEPLPQDMRDLLIRLDQRVQDGFADVRLKLDAMDKRADSIEKRVIDLEKSEASRPILIKQHEAMIDAVKLLTEWRTRSEAQIDGASRMGRWVKGGGTIVLAALAYLGWQVSVHPHAATKVEVHGDNAFNGGAKR